MINKHLGNIIFAVLAVLIIAGGHFYIKSAGREYRLNYEAPYMMKEIVSVSVDETSSGSVEILGWEKTDSGCFADLRSVSPGKVYLVFESPEYTGIEVLYIHKDGVITSNYFFGDCTGVSNVIFCIFLYLAALSGFFLYKYLKLVRIKRYSYVSILFLGLDIFVFFCAISQLEALNSKNGIYGALSSITEMPQLFVVVTLPVVLLTTVVVTVSNIRLIIREGRSWRNLLAFFLGIFLGLGAVVPSVISAFLQSTDLINVHNEIGAGRFAEMFLEDITAAVVMYFECILIGTIIVSIRSARNIPAFDKDYIMILGCQVRKDGTLPKLLRSRADRAMDFAKMQKDATGKDIIFVPSGGKGSNETIAEGEAIRRYLMEKGIDGGRIIAETVSSNTEENFRFSAEKMKEHNGSSDYKAAFSTTNYHVFRSGLLAEKQGLDIEGIGSRTKSYFWINAFVREFIATVVSEKKTHFKVAAILLLITGISVLSAYISEVILVR